MFKVLSLLFLSAALLATPREIVLMRHGNKSVNKANHNLGAAGFKRSLALPDVLLKRFGIPDAILAPQPKPPMGKNMRCIQTISPTAIQAQVNINTTWQVGEESKVAQALMKKKEFNAKMVFITWEHDHIPTLAKGLVASAPKEWAKEDFDSLWIIDFDQSGKAKLTISSEGLGN